MDDTLVGDRLSAVSITGRHWEIRQADNRIAAAIAREWDIPEILARMLLARGIAPDDMGHFLNPNLKTQLPDPSHLLDMDKAAGRLATAVVAGETIAVFGDYDVDGATASAVLLRFFSLLGKRPLLHIPDRITEGYGPNAPAFLALKNKGASVVITVDCGTLAFAPLASAHEAGLHVIVADHHMAEARLPECYALINPNRLDETSPHRQLAAVGVAFLLTVAVQRELKRMGWFATRPTPDLLSLLDLVALGTVCDVVPLTGINRTLVSQGLKIMATRANTGLRTLMDVARVDEPPSAYTCGFILGPRINAGGRVGTAEYGARLLSTDDESEALMLAQALDQYNTERKTIETLVMDEAMAMAEAQIANHSVVLVAADHWHPGVIGIVAGRIKERFGVPAAVVALSHGIGKASARSVAGFDFGAAVIAAVEAGILKIGGGHAMAAGFTVEESYLPALQAFLEQRFAQQGASASGKLMLDGCLALSGATPELAAALERAAPFGQSNAAPRLMLQHVMLADIQEITNGHLRLILTDERCRVTAMAFRAAGTPFADALMQHRGKRIHIACTLRLSIWQNRPQVKLTVEDAMAVN